MATLATGLLARFGRAGFAPAGFLQEVSPSHFRFLPFHAFPSAITMPTLSSLFLSFFLSFSSVFEHTSPFTPRSGLICFFHVCVDDHGSFRNLSVGFSPTQTSLRSVLRP